MGTEFKIGDCVRLIHGYTPDMTVAEIFAATNEAKCTWYDPKTKKIITQDLSLNVLKHCPEKTPIDLEGIKRAMGR
jgi:uncharacterized protein YodC (DUF2158 family)